MRIKTVLTILLSSVYTICLSQINRIKLAHSQVIARPMTRQNPLDIIGDWKCVKHDYRGLEKFTLKQAEEVRKSTLHIEKNIYYFKNVKFIEMCRFDEWVVKPFDAYDLIRTLELTYTKKQLKNVFLLDPVDKAGNTTCFNECAVFKKGNTIITSYGGYIFFWAKVKPRSSMHQNVTH